MPKPLAKVQKSYQDGHVTLRVAASASRRGQSASASVTVDLSLDTARLLLAALGAAIEKEAATIKAREEREARRKAWRDREIAAGRMQTFSTLR